MENKKPLNWKMTVAAVVVMTTMLIVAIVGIVTSNTGNNNSDETEVVVTDDGDTDNDDAPYLDFENANLLSDYINRANISSVTVPLYALLLEPEELVAKVHENDWTDDNGFKNSPNAYRVVLDANEIQNTASYGQQYRVRINLSDGRVYELYFLGDKISGMLYNGLLIYRVLPAADTARLYINFLKPEGYERDAVVEMLLGWGKSIWGKELIVNTINNY